MRFKSWSFYEDWCEIFGKDRATGESAEGFVEAVNNVLNEDVAQTEVEEEGVFEGLDFFADGVGKTAETIPESQPVAPAAPKGKSPMVSRAVSQQNSSATGKGKAGKKRKITDIQETICDC